MAVEFGRGAFENPDDPLHDDDVDTSIVVVTAPEHVEPTRRALERCRDRWWGIDGVGRHHSDDDAAFWDAQADHHGPEWHTAKYVSAVVVDAGGVAVDVDCQGLLPAAMRAAYRDVLVQELTAAGVPDALVHSRHQPDHEPVEQLPAGSWPPYTDTEAPGLPPGVPPGRVIRHDLGRHRSLRNWFLQRDFHDAWEASAAAIVECSEQQAVRTACRHFADAGWTVGQPQASTDWDHRPLTAATMSRPGAVAIVTCQTADHARGRGLPLPKDAKHVLVAIAYYDPQPPTGPPPVGHPTEGQR